MKLSDLKPNPKNPRKITPQELVKLQKSIKGFEKMMTLRPIIYDPADMVVLGGNQRLAALKALSYEEIPDDWVAAAEGLTEKQKKEFILRDNVASGTWDVEVLLQEFDPGLIVDLGIDTRQHNKKLKEDGYELEKKDTKIKLGDIIQIGRHRIVCGDSTDPNTYSRLFPEGIQADAVFTDPPYNVNYSGEGKNTAHGIANDNMDHDEFGVFLSSLFSSMEPFVKGEAGVYVCHASSTQIQFESAMNHAGFFVKNQIVWVKPNASMGWGDYRWMHEPIFYASKEGRTKFYGDRSQYTVWEDELTDEEVVDRYRKERKKDENGRGSVWKMSRDSNYIHPTQKPILLCGTAIQNSTKKDDIILDPFLGSGSTMVAAHQIGRCCYGIELEPGYVQAIIERMKLLDENIEVKIN